MKPNHSFTTSRIYVFFNFVIIQKNQRELIREVILIVRTDVTPVMDDFEYAKNYDATQCEQADSRHDATSAVMWIQVQ